MKQLFTGCVAALFCLSLGVGVARPASQAAVKDGAKKAGEATADTTEKAGTSVKNVFTGEVSATCADGTQHSGKTKAEACAKPGGVKP